MSEQLQSELHSLKIEHTKINARMAAHEQFINSLLKDLLEARTNLNIYTTAHGELVSSLNDSNKSRELLLSEFNSLKEQHQAVVDELATLKNPVCNDDAA